MTCIAAISENGIVTMGADSAGVGGNHICQRRDEKVFIVGNFLIGFTTSFRMGQLIRYRLNPPIHPKNVSIDRYMNTIFIDSIRSVFKDGGYAKTRDGAEEGGTFLVGYRGRIFTIFDDYQVAENIVNYAAIGSGFEVAIGSLFTSVGHPGYRIEKALSAAASFCTGVSAPFQIIDK